MPCKTKERTKASTTTTPLVLPLSPNHLRFVNQYEQQGFKDATQAYQEVYQCKHTTADANAARLMGDDRIRQEITRRIQAGKGITKEFVWSNQLWIIEQAKLNGDHDLFERANMNAGKLAGLLVEKRQELDPELDQVTSEKIWEELSKRVKSPQEIMSENSCSVKSDVEAEKSSKII